MYLHICHLLPVLLIDEVLAVGDVGFRIKCYNKIANLLETAAIILVSHAMPQLAKIGTSILLLDRGQERFLSSDVSRGLEAYYELFDGEEMGEDIQRVLAIYREQVQRMKDRIETEYKVLVNALDWANQAF